MELPSYPDISWFSLNGLAFSPPGEKFVESVIALGAFLGFMAYATFDLTCMALFRDFPLKVVVVDLIWGAVLSSVVTAAGYGIGRWLGIG